MSRLFAFPQPLFLQFRVYLLHLRKTQIRFFINPLSPGGILMVVFTADKLLNAADPRLQQPRGNPYLLVIRNYNYTARGRRTFYQIPY